MRERIFIVEDEAIIALEIRHTITRLGYRFAGMASGYDDALRAIREHQPDLILMDIMLAESRSGIAIARTLLEEDGPVIPVVFLTSVMDETTMREAIQTLPASYLIKPFRREELHSAILLALEQRSRHTHHLNGTMVLGNPLWECRYHPAHRILYLNKHPVRLGPKERRLIDMLVQAKGTLVPFDLLEETIWEGKQVSSSGLRTLIYRLHNKLGHKLIETLPALGCRIAWHDPNRSVHT